MDCKANTKIKRQNEINKKERIPRVIPGRPEQILGVSRLKDIQPLGPDC